MGFSAWPSFRRLLAFRLVVLLLAQLTYAWIERPGRALFNARSERIPGAW